MIVFLMASIFGGSEKCSVGCGKGAERQRGLHFLWRNNLCVIIYVLIVCGGSVCPELGAWMTLRGLGVRGCL